MDFILEGHNYVNDVQTMIQAFFPNESYAITDKPDIHGMTVLSRIQADTCYAAIFEYGRKIVEKKLRIYDNNIKEHKRFVKLTIYNCMHEITGITLPWGILTGIRPAKLVFDLQNELDDESVVDCLERDYLVKRPKAALALEVANAESEILGTKLSDSISFYAGIPFCPSRCLYCSFTSYPIEKYKAKVDSYIDALIKELDFCKPYLRGHSPESFYIGGGTPSSISTEQLERLLIFISDNYNVDNMKEFTLEAGRPDTITREKLRLFKKYGITRISVNPQTMNQKTLDTIGRKHTVQEFINAFLMAREEGFENINIDLILGLPGESADDVKYTISEISKLDPVSLTVHVMAVKRASDLKISMFDYSLPDMETMEDMLAVTADFCRGSGLHPYYMYRQKNSVGENIGYAKKGYECLYNMQIMAERQTIIAAGAGGSTKIVSPVGGSGEVLIKRIFNVKNIDEYIYRIDEMLDRKRNSYGSMFGKADRQDCDK